MGTKTLASALAVTLGGIALSLTAGLGTAAAQPDITPLINTTCSYDQIMAALNAEAPDIAQQLSAIPMAQMRLRKFLSLPPAERATMAQQAIANNPQLQQGNGQVLVQVANTCGNY